MIAYLASLRDLLSSRSIRDLTLWAAMPLRLVLVVPVVAISPIWNLHLHKPGSINARVNSTPLRIGTSAGTARSLQVEAGLRGALTSTCWWSVIGDVLCSEGFNPLLELAFQLNNNHFSESGHPAEGIRIPHIRPPEMRPCSHDDYFERSDGFQRARLALGQISWKVSDNDQLSHNQDAHAWSSSNRPPAYFGDRECCAPA